LHLFTYALLQQQQQGHLLMVAMTTMIMTSLYKTTVRLSLTKPKERPMTSGGFGIKENILFNAYDLKRLGDHENSTKLYGLG
jgi:hypothetical protein